MNMMVHMGLVDFVRKNVNKYLLVLKNIHVNVNFVEKHLKMDDHLVGMFLHVSKIPIN